MKKIFISPYKGVWSIRYEGEDILSLCENLDLAKKEAKIYASKEHNEIYMVRADGSLESIINKRD